MVSVSNSDFTLCSPLNNQVDSWSLGHPSFAFTSLRPFFIAVGWASPKIREPQSSLAPWELWKFELGKQSTVFGPPNFQTHRYPISQDQLKRVDYLPFHNHSQWATCWAHQCQAQSIFQQIQRLPGPVRIIWKGRPEVEVPGPSKAREEPY